MGFIRIISASQAKEYYYEKDPISAPTGKGENAEWFGATILADFGFTDSKVTKARFEALVAGLDPNNPENILVKGKTFRDENGQMVEEHRAGLDFAFSAPKSVSIAALHLGDDRLKEAHKAAVKTAMAFIEQNCIYYRETNGNETRKIQAFGMNAALFEHTISRAEDPQLHTHAVILNIVKTDKGEYRALSNEAILHNQRLINAIYQNELAHNVQQLGYSITNYGNKFEIDGFEEIIDTFSRRTTEIDDWCERNRHKEQYSHMSEAELRDEANLRTREAKKERTHPELKLIWEMLAPASEIKPVEYSEEKKRVLTHEDMLSMAIRELHSKESVFTASQLATRLLEQNRELLTFSEANTLIKGSIKAGKIVELGKVDGKGATFFSTSEMIELEAGIMEAVEKSTGTRKKLIENETINDAIDSCLGTNGYLTQGQRAMVAGILTSEDGIMLIQGDAGTGKTTSVKVLREILDNYESKVEIVGLGYTGKAARELADAAGIETSTIASFLLKKEEQQAEEGQRIILVDEASMVSSRDMTALLNRCKNDRLIFVGDGKQLQAIGAGKMFKELQKNNDTLVLDEVLRQKNWDMKRLVKFIKDIKEAKVKEVVKKKSEQLKEFMIKNEMLVEIESRSGSHQATDELIREKAVEFYLKSDNAILLTFTRREKDTLNETLRDIMLSTEDKKNQQTFTVKHSTIEASLASDFRKGDKVYHESRVYDVKAIDNKNNSIIIEGEQISLDTSNKYIQKDIVYSGEPDIGADVKYRNREYQVLGVENGLLTLQEKDIVIELNKEIVSGFREGERQFAVNDKLMFTQNNKNLNVQNGLTGVINNLDAEGNIAVEIEGGETLGFNISEYNAIDHAYAQTIHKSQGQTTKQAILVHLRNDVINSEAFYVAATRATNDFQVYTYSSEKLIEEATQDQYKTSTLENFIKTEGDLYSVVDSEEMNDGKKNTLDEFREQLYSGDKKEAVKLLKQNGNIHEYNPYKLDKTSIKGSNYEYHIDLTKRKYTDYLDVVNYHTKMQALEEYRISPVDTVIIVPDVEARDRLNKEIRSHLLRYNYLQDSSTFNLNNKSIELGTGDYIIYKDESGNQGKGKIEYIDKDGLMVVSPGGHNRGIVLDINELEKLEYAYAVTPDEKVAAKKGIYLDTGHGIKSEELLSITENLNELKLYTTSTNNFVKSIDSEQETVKINELKNA